MKNASGKRPPDEAHGVPRKRSYQAVAAMPGGVALLHRSELKKKQLNFVKHFRIFAVFFSRFHTFLVIDNLFNFFVVQNSQFL